MRLKARSRSDTKTKQRSRQWGRCFFPCDLFHQLTLNASKRKKAKRSQGTGSLGYSNRLWYMLLISNPTRAEAVSLKTLLKLGKKIDFFKEIEKYGKSTSEPSDIRRAKFGRSITKMDYELF